jgi:hypothetical protein
MRFCLPFGAAFWLLLQALTALQRLTLLVLRQQYTPPDQHPVRGLPALRNKMASLFHAQVEDTEHWFEQREPVVRHTVTCTLQNKASASVLVC